MCAFSAHPLASLRSSCAPVASQEGRYRFFLPPIPRVFKRRCIAFLGLLLRCFDLRKSSVRSKALRAISHTSPFLRPRTGPRLPPRVCGSSHHRSHPARCRHTHSRASLVRRGCSSGRRVRSLASYTCSGTMPTPKRGWPCTSAQRTQAPRTGLSLSSACLLGACMRSLCVLATAVSARVYKQPLT